MAAPCRFLADGLDLEVDTTIRQLQRRADGWHLLSAERGWLDPSFDVVLLALPAPKAAPLLPEAATGSAGVGDAPLALCRRRHPLDHRCLWHDGSRIGLCGDWLNGGKVEGAWQSGRKLGERVAAHFRDHGVASVAREARE